MFFAIAVTGLTGGGTGIAAHAMFGLINREDGSGFRLIMTSCTESVPGFRHRSNGLRRLNASIHVRQVIGIRRPNC